MSRIVQFVRATRFLATAALAAVLATPLAACKTTGGSDTTGSIGGSEPRTEAEWRNAAETWGARYRDDTGDAGAAIRYAQALRMTDRRAQAVAVLEQATIKNPKDPALLSAFGRALADVGRYDQALDVLGRAHSPDNPDWRVLNAMGATLDQLGRHADARRHYTSALKIRPNEPSILSNLGLSSALTKDLPRAESYLRRAVSQPGSDPKVRQNLGLVVGLQGRFDEAETIVRADLPADQASAAVAELRQMISQRNEWKSGERAAPAKRRNRS